MIALTLMHYTAPSSITVGCHFSFVTSGKHKARSALLVNIRGCGLGEAAPYPGSAAAPHKGPSLNASLWHSSASRRGWSLQHPSLLSHPCLPPSSLQTGVTDNAQLFGESTDWWHHERLGVNCCYLGESCHLCSRCAAQIPASSEPLCAAALPLPAKDSGRFAKLPSHKRNHLCRSSFFFFSSFCTWAQLDTHTRAYCTHNTHPHTSPGFIFRNCL